MARSEAAVPRQQLSEGWPHQVTHGGSALGLFLFCAFSKEIGSEQIPKSTIAALGVIPGSEGNHGLFCAFCADLSSILLDFINLLANAVECS